MKTLWLHKLGDPLFWRKSVSQLENILKSHGGPGEVLVWDANYGSPSWLRKTNWDAIFFGPTFLNDRFDVTKYSAFKTFEWVGSSSAAKIALPQDEYDSPSPLDQWLSLINVDAIISCFPEKADVLYPSLNTDKTRICKGYTGFISDNLLESKKLFFRPNREIDVSYRAVSLTRRYGELGRMKTAIADWFEEKAGASESIVTDISTKLEDTLYGSSWYQLLANSRHTLAVPSGSSVLDLTGNVRSCLGREIPPTRESVDWLSPCISEKNLGHEFEALSPRHLEASIFETVQIGLSGHYGGILVPGRDMIEVKRDLGNFDEVVYWMQDENKGRELRENALAAIREEPLLWEKGLTSFLTELAGDIRSTRPGTRVKRGTEVAPLKANLRKKVWNLCFWKFSRVTRRIPLLHKVARRVFLVLFRAYI